LTKGVLFNRNYGRSTPVETLENYCNERRCVYYPTKPERAPLSMQSAIAAAEDVRERAKLNLLPPYEKRSAFSVACALAAERAQDTVDSEPEDVQSDKPVKPSGSAFEHWNE
jgi:hypothetical protein